MPLMPITLDSSQPQTALLNVRSINHETLLGNTGHVPILNRFIE